MALTIKKFVFIPLLILITQMTQIDNIVAQEQLFADNLTDLYWQHTDELRTSIKKAEALIENGYQLQAIPEFETILKKHPDYISAWRRLAQLYSWNEKPEKAITCYERIISLDALDSYSMKTLAQNYIWNNRQKEAIGLLEKVIILEPDSLRIHKKLAKLYSWNNMSEKLIQQYERIIQLAPTDAQTIKKLAANYSWNNKPLMAIKMLEQFIANHPDSLNVRKELAQQYEWNNMPQNAIMQYETIIKSDSTEIDLMKKLAQQYMWNDRSAEAVPLYHKILASEPENTSCKIQLANAYLGNNQGKRAEQPLMEILREQPYNKDVLLSLAELERWSGKWDQAKNKLKKLLLFDPNNEKALKLLSGIRRQYGTVPEARYYRISDSNKLTQEQLPITTTCFFNKHWEYVFSAAHYRVMDGRLDSTMSGYGAKVATKYNYSPSTSTLMELAVTNYSSNWTPLSFKIQLNQQFFDKIFANVKYFRRETREGVRALTGKILIDGYAGELYCQMIKRWGLSGNYIFQTYSDDNRKITATAYSNLIINFRNPQFYLFGYYSFEDFKNIYTNSLPYWTPEKLETSSVGLNISQNIFSWINIGAGYSLAHQKTIYSNNFSGQIAITFSQYGRIFFQYIKNGSKFYNAESFLAYLQYRF